MEGDVVFAHEVERFGFFVKPEFTPLLRLPQTLALLDGGGNVAQNGVNPNVDGFAFCPFKRRWNSPFDVAGDCSGF